MNAPAKGAAPPTLPPRHVETSVLENGLTLLVCADPSAPVVSLQGWCKTGSIHEGAWTGAGLSHILEHMLFKGTESRGASEVASDVSSLGGQINAYTSFDRTVYYIEAPSASCGGCLDVLMGVVARATIPADEFELEQEVIRREFAMGDDDPDRVASKELFATAFQTHPYGVPVIGYRQVFDQLTRDDVVGYYRERYAPNNTFFVVVGDVDPERVKEQFAAFYADLPRRPVAPVFVPEEPRQMARRERYRPFATPVSKLWMAWKIPGVTHRDMPALDVLSTVLGDGRSSRLYREVREGKGLVHRIDAFSYTPAGEGLFAVGADLDPQHRGAAEGAVLDEVARLMDSGISESELEKARKVALASQLGAMVSTRGVAADVGVNWLLTGEFDFTRNYLKSLAEVSAEDVVGVARRYLGDDSSLSVIEVGERPGVVPSPSGLAREPADVDQFELDNGMRVIVQNDPRLPLVALNASFSAGVLVEDESSAGSTALLAASLFHGSKRRDAAAMADAIEGCGGSAGAGGGNNSLYVNANAMAPDAGVAFEIAAEAIAVPALPEPAVARERQAQIAAIEEDEQQPTGLAFSLARAALFGDHPLARRRAGTVEAVAGHGPEQLEVFRAAHLTAANGVLSICGDIDTARARELAEKHFGSLAAGEPIPPAPNPVWPEGESEVVAQLDKEQAVVVLAVPGVGIADPMRPAIDVLEEALSGMDGRLFLRIREEMGLAYFTGASQIVSLPAGGFLVYAGTRSDAADDVAAEMGRVLSRLASDGLEDRELQRAKRVYAGKHRLEKQSPASRAQGAALDVLYSLGFGHDEAHLSKVEAMTQTDVAEAAAAVFGGAAPRCIVKVAP